MDEDKSDSIGTEPAGRMVCCEAISLNGFLFPGNTSFKGATFRGEASFISAAFMDDALFENVSFKGNASFINTVFHGNTSFDNAAFMRNSNFIGTAIKGDGSFRRATFKGNASFINAAFHGDASYRNVAFMGNSSLSSAKFMHTADFIGTSFKSTTAFIDTSFEGDAYFNNTTFWHNADFRGVDVIGNADFRYATFNGNAYFGNVAFRSDANYHRAVFSHYVSFHSAAFDDYATFESAAFKKRASFINVVFNSYADFIKVVFTGDAMFRQADFLSQVDFSGTLFSDSSDWTAINSARAFEVAGVRFETQVPQFSQAHFTESPRLDNIELPMPERGGDNLPTPRPETGWVTTQVHSWGWTGGERQDETGNDTYHTPYQTNWEELEEGKELGDAPEGETHQEVMRDGKRYRVRQRSTPKPKPGKPINQNHIAAFTALRRIAKQGEDHETERKAFKGEMRTQRIAGDHGLPYHLFSWAYDLFTDFGGSFLRPFLLWAALSIASAFIYTGAATSPINKIEQATCSHLLTHAFLLSARNALLFATAGQRPFLTKSLDCLYGKEPKEEAIQNTTRTGPPPWLGLFGTFQTLLSAILIFFILLALRNRFKI